MALPKKSRLSQSQSIEKIFLKGSSYTTPFFRVRFEESLEKNICLAVVVSKKQSKNAADRNRIRRRLQEVFRLLLQSKYIKKGGKFIVQGSENVLLASFEDIQKEAEKFGIRKNFF